MISNFKRKSSSFKQSLCLTLLSLLMICCLSNFYAADYDFNKLSSLANQRYGQAAYQNILEFNQMIASLKTASDLEKLHGINDFFNQKIKFTDDIELWGQTDYWATPLETIGKQAGDCEDFSIAKYAFLKVMNISDDKLRLTYVRAELAGNQNSAIKAHMVLSYYATPLSEPLILDNLNPEIMPASKRTDLAPIFSFNSKGLWLGSSLKPKAESQTHLSRWRDVLTRIQADGIK